MGSSRRHIEGFTVGLILACWSLMLFPIDADSRTVNATDESLTVIMAGVPEFIVGSRDYDRLFSQLADHHITAFLPTFQYQEQPTSLSLGYEADFLPPCRADDPAFTAMRDHHIKLIIPGQLLYASAPSSTTDPLLTLMECAGEDMVAAVFNIDEPFAAITDWQQPYQDVETLYKRVKAVAPDLPVMMVHAPISAYAVDDSGGIRPITSKEVDFYLKTTRELSQFSDIVGFDVYPVSLDGGTITTPAQAPYIPKTSAKFIPDYLDWLHENLPGHPTFMVLQAFSFSRQYAESPYPDLFPTQAELKAMACQTLAHEGQALAWWGQSFLKEEDEAFWQSVLTVSKNIATDGHRYCSDA